MVTKSRKRGCVMSTINNSKKYAIMWLNSQGKSNDDIAKELSVSIEAVSKIISEIPQPQTQPISSKNLMITHTAGKKNNTVAIMTKEASELNDAKSKNIQQKPISNGIFRPKST